ncbi:hypothetical protein IQ273_28085, partial [Nodosilinea sp. LEGE 07298]|uniref:hypothetical protein n=1 Tax=Nodosilinea sp. LEGE 07298 TaxID=2777970 RepID=UPI0019F67396
MAPDDAAAAVTDSAPDDFVTGTEAALPEVPLAVPEPESPESPESSALADSGAAEHSTPAPNLDPPA